MELTIKEVHKAGLPPKKTFILDGMEFDFNHYLSRQLTATDSEEGYGVCSYLGVRAFYRGDASVIVDLGETNITNLPAREMMQELVRRVALVKDAFAREYPAKEVVVSHVF